MSKRRALVYLAVALTLFAIMGAMTRCDLRASRMNEIHATDAPEGRIR